MGRSRYAIAFKVDAVYRVERRGEHKKAVARELGFSRQTLTAWCKDPEILQLVNQRSVLEEHAEAEAEARASAGAELVSELEFKRIVDAAKSGMPPHRALRLINRTPKTWETWRELAASNPEARRIVQAMERASAERELECVIRVTNGVMGWQGPFAYLKTIAPDTYDPQPEDEGRERPPHSIDQLMAIANAGLKAARAEERRQRGGREPEGAILQELPAPEGASG